MSDNTLRQRYDKLAAKRDPFLQRAQEASKLTIPSLIPEDGTSSTTSFVAPWQSIGARGVNNLAAKMQLSLFPPSQSFFRMQVDAAKLAEIEDEATKGDIEKALAQIEQAVVEDLEGAAVRPVMFSGFKHLVVGGNVLLFNEDDGSARMYPLSRYVVLRSASGKVLATIALDHDVFGALDASLRDQLRDAGVAKNADDDVDIYTGVFRDSDNKQWKVWQEVEGIVIPGSEGTYPEDASPWLPLRFIAVEGESYGRSFIEEIFGDLQTVDALTEAVVTSSAAAAVLKFLVDPNGSTDVKEVARIPNGGFAEGRAEDITSVQAQKFADLRVALEALNNLRQELSASFLLNSAVQRNAERVTAEEIRFVAQELEDAFGGIYSVLSQELQLPLVKWRLKNLARQKRIPAVPPSVKPVIITGLEALGRGHDFQRMRAFVGDANGTFGPEVVAEYVDVSEYLKRSASGLNIKTDGLVRTDEEVQARRQEQLEQQLQLQQQYAPNQGGQ